MYSLLRTMKLNEFLGTQLPTLVVSLIIAERYYSGLHSFTKECLAFLATWFVLDAILSTAIRLWQGRRDTTSKD